MEHAELLRYLVAAIERLGLGYMVTGSVATIFFGEPRFTNDIDIVVVLGLEQIPEFCRAFPAPDFYLSEDAVREAVQQHAQFNIIHPSSGLKIDVIIPQDTSFNRSRFARAKRIKPAEDYEASFASVEDVIIKKMEYFRQAGSEKHLRDISGVLKISGSEVNRDYIADWAVKMGLESIWKAILDRLE